MDENTYQKLRNVLKNMKYRCTNSNEKFYHHYGGRGIKICDRWTDTTRVPDNRRNNPSQGLLNFIEDMGSTYFEDASIDRIDNDGDYTPENCQWLTKSENSIKAHIGSKHSDEARRKISEAQKGRTFSEEHRRKLSEAKQGRTLSKEHCRKMSESQKGLKRKPFSEEHRRKLSESRKRYLEKSCQKR